MSLPALFVSHSSQQEPVEVELLQKLRAALTGKVELLLDQDLLKGGDDWRQEIHTWMAVCQAAVVLFSPGVLARPKWVRKEAFILEWRKTQDDRFLLIPVYLPGFDRGKLETIDLDPAHLERLQSPTAPAVTGDTAAVLCTRLLEALKPLEKATAENSLRSLILSLEAEFAPLTDDQCDAARAGLAGQPEAWTPATTAKGRLAYAMTHAPLTKVALALSQLHGTLKEHTLRAAQILASFWVQAEAASRLAAAARRPPGCRTAVLNTDSEDIGKYYIWRALLAYMPEQGWCSVTIRDDEHAAADVFQQLVTHFGKLLPMVKREDLPHRVARRCGPGAPVSYFLLWPPGPEPVARPTVEAIRTYPSLSGSTLLLLSPPTFQSRPGYTAEDAEFVEPRLEDQALNELNDFFTDAGT